MRKRPLHRATKRNWWKTLALTLIVIYLIAWPIGAYLMGAMGPFHHAGVYLYNRSGTKVIASVSAGNSSISKVEIPSGEYRFLCKSNKSLIRSKVVLVNTAGEPLATYGFPSNPLAYEVDIEFTYPASLGVQP